MIKKLRIKFVCITMTIVTLLLCVILGLVYYFTKSEMELQSITMMNNIALGPYRVNTPVEPDGEIRLPFFTVRLGPDGEQIEIGGSYYDLSDKGILDEIIDKSQEPGHQMGVIKKYNLRYCRIEGPRYTYLVFSDISSELATLKGLMENCLIIGVTGFLLFLGASILLSGWAVKPVDEAFRQQRRFIADASHELKTPLAVIMTNAQLIQDSVKTNTLEVNPANNIIIMSRQMNSLVEQMLCLARTDGGDHETVFETLDLSKLVSSTLLPFEPLFYEKNLELKSEIEDGIMISGNKEELRRLLEILLDNACKYSSQNGKTFVTLKHNTKKTIRLSVSNEGEEIDSEKLELLFQRFYRADSARSRNGSFGLGLPIARSIAEKHKGKIWFKSESGLNSCIFEMNRI